MDIALLADFDYNLLLLLLAGFAAGFINVIAGGGSLISLPILIFLGLPPSVANGTNRLGILFQTSTAVVGFRSKGISTFPFSLYCGIAATIGSIIGAQIAVDIKGETFNKILAIVMIVVVLLIVFKPKVSVESLIERTTGKHLWISMLVFFFLGIYGGFINAGIGFILLLFLSYFNKMTLVKANATKVTIAAIYTFAALMVFIFNDKISWVHGILLALGNALGAWISSRLSVRKGDGFIRIFLLIMVSAMAIKLWFFDLS
ncbi:MAG: sulfite exporter TauE/SafE family protein [Bacteroidia bacterium]|nr:sulfite exporter TauE/SafE family protein [Bacteroidia bacterium]NND26682.1 sulfite exporter TauE/SafE family protein [Flavobacteriaceae bacterium]MBT8279136.1 sulfite exporter TauE/SafE family protein [Bacteroidia bacterium]NNK60900.1 sulfite exporter TauE/SafE family protein [Flavobacteriaceae bacterium]NNL34139.1 sulfite exporter TauE/SafE family protein [Flavobacteriaceae bacterium]